MAIFLVLIHPLVVSYYNPRSIRLKRPPLVILDTCLVQVGEDFWQVFIAYLHAVAIDVEHDVDVEFYE